MLQIVSLRINLDCQKLMSLSPKSWMNPYIGGATTISGGQGGNKFIQSDLRFGQAA
jgi:hypothetical protein